MKLLPLFIISVFTFTSIVIAQETETNSTIDTETRTSDRETETNARNPQLNDETEARRQILERVTQQREAATRIETETRNNVRPINTEAEITTESRVESRNPRTINNTTPTRQPNPDLSEGNDQRRAEFNNQAQRKTDRTERQAEMQRMRQEKRAEITSTIETRKVELRQRFSTNAQVRIDRRIAEFNSRYLRALDKAEDIYIRLETRLDKLVTAGIDVSEAETQLEVAKAALDVARNTTIEASVKSEAILEVDNTIDLWESAKESYEQARSNLAAVRDALQLSARLAVQASSESRNSETPDEVARNQESNESAQIEN